MSSCSWYRVPLGSWLLTVVIVAVVDHRHYRGVRDDWQEVRMFCSPDFRGRGLGGSIPASPPCCCTHR